MTPEMAGISLMLLWVLAVSLVEARAIDLTKRNVLTDLSGGFCRSYRFGGTYVKPFHSTGDLLMSFPSGHCRRYVVYGWSGWRNHPE